MEETSNNRSESLTVKQRIAGDRELLLDQLKKTPIVQLACEKTGIGRATYYRWRKEDQEFARLADIAIEEGSLLINDVAESQLLSAIKDKNMTAIIFWLKHHHRAYATKIEISASTRDQDEVLSEEQESLIRRALLLASLTPANSSSEDKKDE
jgi:hypothetical protein